jgi:hypothetical protein
VPAVFDARRDGRPVGVDRGRVACGWVITLWWKISVHAAIAAGAATVLLLVFGTALGVVVNATVFPLLRSPGLRVGSRPTVP